MKILLVILIVFFAKFELDAQTWTQIGPEGGYFKEFTIDPSNANTIYAGSDDGGGIWKSLDGGMNWSLLTSNFPNMTGWRVVLDDNNSSVVYGCDLYGRYGLLKSVDGGQNWTIANTGLSSIYDKMVSGLAVKTADTLFISTGESTTSNPVRPGNGVFRSYDAGATWLPAGLQGTTVPAIGKNDFGTIFAGTENLGLHYTNDNGMNWIAHPDIPSSGSIYEIDTDGNTLVVASSEGVFLSTDWGINFTYIGLVGEFNFDACIHRTNPDIEIFSSTTNGLKRYSSLTANWTLVTGTYFSDQIIIGLESDGTNVYCSGFSNSPIEVSDDGGNNWSPANSSPIATELSDLYLNPANNNHLMCCLLGSYDLDGDFDRESVYESLDGGQTWNRKGPDAHALCLTVNPQNDQEFYLGSFAQGVYKTTDRFDTFTQLSPDGFAVGEIAVSSSNPDIVIISEVDWNGGPSASLKRSTDAGNSFNTVANIAANRLLFHPLNNDTVYAATFDGIYRSIDFGLSFNPWLLSGEDCGSIATRENDLFVGTNDGKAFKISGGIATEITGNWNFPVEIKSIKTIGGDLFVGMNGAEKDTTMVLEGSIWQSSDDGLNWQDITSDMTSTNIYGNNVIETDGQELYVATYGGGIFRSSGVNLTVSLEESFLSKEKKLLRVIDLMGRPANNQTNTVLIHIYSDGTTEKKIRLQD